MGKERNKRVNEPKPVRYCKCGCGVVVRKNWVLTHQKINRDPQYKEEDRGYETPCWIWQRGKTAEGYGTITVDGKYWYSHRLYYTKTKGDIPDKYFIDHLCRVPSCVNPEHLEAVLPAINIRRGNHGKLTIENVREIRSSIGFNKIKLQEWAKRWDVSLSGVAAVAYGRTWKDVVV